MKLRQYLGTALFLLIAGCQFNGCDSQPPRTQPPQTPKSEPPRTGPVPQEWPSRHEPVATINTPLLLVPGILGSWTKNSSLIETSAYVRDLNEWVLAEQAFGYIVADVFGHIRQRLTSRGYREGKDFFAAPYDWRQPTDDHNAIMAWIDVAKAQFRLTTGKTAEQVDIVAHSMGGLIARNYVQSASYRKDIRRLALVAVPHFGAADAYYLWAGGKVPPNAMSPRAASFLQNRLAAMNRRIDPDPSRNIITFVRRYVLSGRDLLPVAMEVVDKEGYLWGWPEPGLTPFTAMNVVNRNEKLTELNKGLVDLKTRTDVRFFLGRDRSTLERIYVAKSSRPDEWEDGEPVREPDKHKFVDGDERVLFISRPLSSVANIDTASTSHQNAVCTFTPEIFTFLGIPTTAQDRCSGAPRPAASAIAFGLSTTSKADLTVSGPEGKLVGLQEGRVLKWETSQSFDLVVLEPRDGLYELTVAGNVGEHNVFATYAKAPLQTEFIEAKPFMFSASSTETVRVELKDGGLSIK